MERDEWELTFLVIAGPSRMALDGWDSPPAKRLYEEARKVAGNAGRATARYFPPEQRFKPRKVPHALVEQISPLTERRVLHDVNVTNLNFGHRKLFTGTEMVVPGRAAFALTYSGCARIVDEPATEAATAAA